MPIRRFLLKATKVHDLPMTILRRALLCLATGVSVNIGVAWWCACRSPTGCPDASQPQSERSSPRLIWPTPVPADWSQSPETLDTWTGPGIRVRWAQAHGPEPLDTRTNATLYNSRPSTQNSPFAQ